MSETIERQKNEILRLQKENARLCTLLNTATQAAARYQVECDNLCTKLIRIIEVLAQ
jgi:hypothetical protein